MHVRQHTWLLPWYIPVSQAVEKLVQAAESGCPSEREKQVVLNCTRILTRILPYIFEDQDWRGFFWSTVPGAGRAGVSNFSLRFRICIFQTALTKIEIRHPHCWGRECFFSVKEQSCDSHAALIQAVWKYENKVGPCVSGVLLLQDQLRPGHFVACSSQKRNGTWGFLIENEYSPVWESIIVYLRWFWDL